MPGELVTSSEAAAAAARRLGYPVALRISSAQITHKSDVGGVALGLRTVAQLRAGYKRVSAAAAGAGLRTDVDGVMVTAMRTGGVELLAGVTVDPAFGPVLAVGLGGIWVEVLGDVALRVLPVGPDEVIAMLGELRGAPLLRGARGSAPADLDALARVIGGIADAALSLGDSLHALEVNPLWVDGDQIEALDVLVVTDAPGQNKPGQTRTPRRQPEQNGTPNMKLAYSTEQQELRESVRRFLADRMPLPRVRELMDSADGTDEKVWSYAGSQLGLQGIAIPEQYGGAGFTFTEQAIVLEELGARAVPGTVPGQRRPGRDGPARELGRGCEGRPAASHRQRRDGGDAGLHRGRRLVGSRRDQALGRGRRATAAAATAARGELGARRAQELRAGRAHRRPDPGRRADRRRTVAVRRAGRRGGPDPHRAARAGPDPQAGQAASSPRRPPG